MKPSKYLEKVQRAVTEAKDGFVLTGNVLLVEKVPHEEVKTKSGLVLATHTGKDQVNSISANMPVFVHVLAVGSGFYDTVKDDDGNDVGVDVPLDTKPGDILLVGQHSARWLSVFPIDNYEPFTVGVTSEAETQMRFRGLEAYGEFAKALNRQPENQVDGQGGGAEKA